MQSGSMDAIYKMMDLAVKGGIAEKYDAVVKARELAPRPGTVRAYREQAEAGLIFEKYVYDLYGAASAAEPHAEGQAAEHIH